jgi:hypothetical protein
VVDDTAKLASDAATRLDPAERRLLAGMPLHAITSVHSEAGLRERLLIEIAQFPAADRARVDEALALASRLHARERRQREPYANHLLRVTIRILSHYRVTDPDVACAALLHDAVEDHAEDIAPGGTRQAFAVLARQFGRRTADLVAAVTNPVYESGRDEQEQYHQHSTRAAAVTAVDMGPQNARARGMIWSRRDCTPLHSPTGQALPASDQFQHAGGQGSPTRRHWAPRHSTGQAMLPVSIIFSSIC